MRFSNTIYKLIIFLILASQIVLACAGQQPVTASNDIVSNEPTALPPTCDFGFYSPSSMQTSINGLGEFTFHWAEQPGAVLYVLMIDNNNTTLFNEATSDTSITVNMEQFTELGSYLATVTAITAQETILCKIHYSFTINLGVPNCQLAWIAPAPNVLNIPNVATKFDWIDEPQAALYLLSITTPSNKTIDYVALDGSQKIIELNAFTEDGEYILNLKALKDKDTLICEITRKLWILQTKSGENEQGGSNNNDIQSPPIPTSTPTNPPPG